MDLYVLPYFILFYKSNGLFRNIKHYCYFCLNHSLFQKVTYLSDLRIAKNRHSMSFSSRYNISPLRMHISKVIRSGTKKKMGRFYTSWIVTSMTNKKIVWDRAITKFPHDSVRIFKCLAVVKFKNGSLTVVKGSDPIPTVSLYFNFWNESFKKRKGAWSVLSFQTRWAGY